MASLFFRAHGDSRMRTCFQKSPIKFTTAKLPSTRIILRNEWSGFEKSQPFATLGYLEKSERFTGKIRFFLGWTCYTCENTSLFSRKSRVLHTFEVCAPTGYTRERGGPVVLTILLFKNIVDNWCVWRWKYYLCSYQEFYQKSVTQVLHWFLDEKVIRQTQSLTTINFNKSIFSLVFHLIPKGVLWGVYEWKIKKLFPSKNIIHAGQHTVGSYFLYPFKWWKILHRARLINIWKLFLALTRSCAVLVNQELILAFIDIQGLQYWPLFGLVLCIERKKLQSGKPTWEY